MRTGKRKWIVEPAVDAAQVASEFKIHPVVAALLVRRGFSDSSAIRRFLSPSLEDLESPFAFEDMNKAVARIRAAISKKEKILIYGDYDVDGITGCAILYPILRKLGAEVEAYIPHRIEEGYGLNRDTLERLLKKKYSLIVTVDNGITGVEPVRFLREKGVDVIIVDHHTPKEEIPPAYAIVSAAVGRMTGDAGLAACGVAFKMGWALLDDFGAVKDYLDLAALGTIADLAPVTGDNRTILKYGLEELSKSRRPGIRALIDAAGLSRTRLSYRDIAFGLGPRINASGRMGSPENAFKILTTDNPVLAQNLAQILNDGNRDRQRVEQAAFEEALLRVEREMMAVTDRVFVLDSPDWHEGILGIVAARLAERYQRPSIVICRKNTLGKGSGRSVPHFSLFDSVLKCEELLENFGGHAQACGITIKSENIPLFRNRLNQIVSNEMESRRFEPELQIDAEIPLDQIDLKLITDLEKMAPFGPGNKKPLFLSRNARFKSEPRKRGQDTLHGWLSDGAGKTTCEVVGFRNYSRWMASGKKNQLNLVYQPTLKDFNGIRSIQLELEDWS